MDKIAVIGATGFAGKAVCHELERAGYDVGKFSPSFNGFNLLDLPCATHMLSEYKPLYIVNCAALVGGLNYVGRYPFGILDINSRLALNLYDIALYLDCKIVNPIANCGYPGSSNTFIESEFQNGPVHPSVLGYGFTRRLLLTASQAAKAQYETDSINLFVPNMYGPGDSTDLDRLHALNALALKFVKAKRSNAPSVEVFGTGAPIREWLYTGDFARFVVLAIQNNIINDPVNLAQNYGISIRQLVDLIAEACNYDGEVVYNVSYSDGAPCKLMDNTLFENKFPEFEFTELGRGIAKTVEYYEDVL